jgi:phage gpG-like protein
MAKVLTEQIDDLQFLGGVYVDIEQRFVNADYSEVLEAQLGPLEKDHGEAFATEQAANGEDWAELAASTIQRKGHDRILRDTGELRSSLAGQHSNAIREVTHRGLIFGTRDERAGYHQEGTSRMPARPPVGVTETRLDSIAEAVADSLVAQLRHTL